MLCTTTSFMFHPVRNYHFDDACVWFTKDANNHSFTQHPLKLSTIQFEGTYNILKMSEAQMIDHVTQLHDAQTKKKVDEEEALTTTTTKEKVASVQDEAYAKVMDDTIVCGVIIDLTNTATMKETPKVSNAAIADEVVHHIQEPVSK